MSYMNFTEFLATQGVLPHDWILTSAATISADGRTIGGGAASPFAFQGWILQMDRAVLCHASPGSPADQRTILVDFPDSLEDHLDYGDVIGICGSGVL